MPIPRQRFNQARDDNALLDTAVDRILDFLESRPDEAFSEDEIIEALRDEWPSEFDPIEDVVSCVPADIRMIDGQTYYAAPRSSGR